MTNCINITSAKSHKPTSSDACEPARIATTDLSSDKLACTKAKSADTKMEKRPQAKSTLRPQAKAPWPSYEVEDETVAHSSGINKSTLNTLCLLLRNADQLRHGDLKVMSMKHKPAATKRVKPSAEGASEPPMKIWLTDMSMLVMEKATYKMLGRCALTIGEIVQRHANLQIFGYDRYGKLERGLPGVDETFSRFWLPMRRGSPIETADIVVLSTGEEVRLTEIFLAEEVGL